MSDERTIKAVKILVLAMAACIVVGLGIVAYGLFIKAGDSAPASASSSPAAAAADSSRYQRIPFGTVTLASPPGGTHGTRIVAMMADGAERLILRLADDGGRKQRIVIIDLLTGHVLGTIVTDSVPAGSAP
ncbi:MAG: hypothetical protein FD153_948 [Rhodospirillaceae bacterium]|nr:MAG: hypothetical protein FD153_948 [Rhodospirillaceae bacterium]